MIMGINTEKLSFEWWEIRWVYSPTAGNHSGSLNITTYIMASRHPQKATCVTWLSSYFPNICRLQIPAKQIKNIWFWVPIVFCSFASKKGQTTFPILLDARYTNILKPVVLKICDTCQIGEFPAGCLLVRSSKLPPTFVLQRPGEK